MAAIQGWTGWLGTVLGTPDPPGLAKFYAGLLGGEVNDADPGFVTFQLPGASYYLGFQLELDHRPPTWPAAGDEQQMQVHLDIGVRDVATAVNEAVALGGQVADFQPQADVRVLLDPAGHPFCLYLDEE